MNHKGENRQATRSGGLPAFFLSIRRNNNSGDLLVSTVGKRPGVAPSDSSCHELMGPSRMKIPRNSLAGIREIMRFVVFWSYFKKRMIDFSHAYVTLVMTERNQACHSWRSLCRG